jgi:hypothetical protein
MVTGCDRRRVALLRLVDLDAKAYGRLLKVWRSRNRQHSVRQAQRGALQALLAICEQIQAVLRHGPSLMKASGRSLASTRRRIERRYGPLASTRRRIERRYGPLASDVEAGTALLVAGFVAAAAMVAENLEGMGQHRDAARIRGVLAADLLGRRRYKGLSLRNRC